MKKGIKAPLIFRHSYLPFMRRLKRSLALALSVVFIAAPIAAEDISICGVRFPVDSTKRMNDGSIKVDINGYAKLVSPSQLNDYVVNENFKDTEFRKAAHPDTLLDFIFCAAEQGERKWAEIALSAIIESGESTAEHVTTLLSRLKGEDEIIKGALLGASDSESKPIVLIPLLLHIGEGDTEWLRTYGARWAFKRGADLRKGFVENFISSLSDAAYEKKTSIPLGVLEALYGADDSTVVKIKSVLSRVNSIQSALRGENLSSVLTLLSSDDSDPEVSSMLEPVILETIHREAKNLLQEGRASDALLVLSRLKLERRTPTTHELVRESLRKLSVADISAVDHAGISEMLKFLCDKDEEIRRLWLEKLASGTSFLISRGEMGNASRLVERLSVIPSVGSDVADPLRFKIAKAYYAVGDESNGQQTILSMTRAPSFTERISLYAARLSRLGVTILVLLVVAAAAIGFSPGKVSGFVSRIKGWFISNDTSHVEEDEYEDDASAELPRFVSLSAMSKYDPRLEEYSALLELFGLKLGANEKQIKAAYRLKMKEVHPDLKGDRNKESDAEFISFRGKYERLVELHRSRLARMGENS